MTEDVRQLLNALAEVAGTLLEEEGYFPPAGAVMTTEGEVQVLQVVPEEGEGEAIDPEQQVELLQDAFREAREKGKIRACAFSLDVHVENPDSEEENDAILVSAEVEGGDAFEIFLPYAVDGEEVELLQPFAVQREAAVFT